MESVKLTYTDGERRVVRESSVEGIADGKVNGDLEEIVFQHDETGNKNSQYQSLVEHQ